MDEKQLFRTATPHLFIYLFTYISWEFFIFKSYSVSGKGDCSQILPAVPQKHCAKLVLFSPKWNNFFSWVDLVSDDSYLNLSNTEGG